MSNYPPGPGRGISEGSCSISFISLELRKAYKTMAVISLTTHSEGVLGAVVGLCILHLIMLVALYATRIPAMIRRKIDPQKGAVAKDLGALLPECGALPTTTTICAKHPQFFTPSRVL